jgi:hypothetical protein
MIYLSGMKFSQAPSTILMVRPAAFGFNQQTAGSNAFQQAGNQPDIRRLALDEFDRMVDTLVAHDIDVLVVEDSPTPERPDAIFPNNWISFHHDGRVVLYPMLAENRRLERSVEVVELIKKDFAIQEVIDFSNYEAQAKYLEGTGSIVLDYVNGIAYANRSPRTDELVFLELCKQLGYKPILFNAVDESGQPIYHTNVLMCVGSEFAIVCLDAVRDDHDQEVLLDSFSKTGHQVVAISYAQMKAFAGNMMEVKTKGDEPIVLLSESAFNSLLPGQLQGINKHAEVLPLSIPTIERFGGGSVRCMVAGIFLPKH